MKNRLNEFVFICQNIFNHIWKKHVEVSLIKAFLISFFSTVIVILLSKWEFLFSPMLIEDDQIYLTNMIYGFGSWQGYHFIKLSSSVNAFGIIGARFFLVFIVSVSFAIITGIIYKKLRVSYILILPAIAMAIPVSVTQFIFLNGSHPTWTIPFIALLFVCVAIIGKNIPIWQLIAITVIGAFLSNFISFSSTLTPLVPLAFFVFFIDIYQKKKNNIISSFALIIVSVYGPLNYAFKFYFQPASRNHYIDKPGWLVEDIGGITERIGVLYEYVLSRQQTTNSLIILVIIILASTIISVYLRRRHSKINKKVNLNNFVFRPSTFALAFLAIAALSLVPALIVTQTADRYIELPIIFAIIGFLLLFIIIIQKAIVHQLLFAGLLVGTTISVILNRDLHYNRYNTLHNISVHLKKQFNYLRSHWPEGAQIIIVGESMPFSGYNHWSSGVLRHLSGRSDIIGLVGSSNLAINNPLVDKWTEHSTHYWSINKNGRAYRKQMMGLEADRPTFTYSYDSETGTLTPKDLLVIQEDGMVLTAKYASSIESSGFINSYLSKYCSQIERKQTPIVFGSIKNANIPPHPSNAERILIKYDDKISFNPILNESGSISGDFWFMPGDVVFGSKKLGDDYPPTPMLWRENFQFWQLDHNEWALQSGNLSIRSFSEEAYFHFEIWPDCATLFQLNDIVSVRFGYGKDSGVIVVGQGFLNRKWAGQVITQIN